MALIRNKTRKRILSDDIVKTVHNNCTKRRHLWKEFDCEYINYKDLLDKNYNFSNIY